MKFCLNYTSFFHYYTKNYFSKSKNKCPSYVYSHVLIYLGENYNSIYKAVLRAVMRFVCFEGMWIKRNSHL